MQILNNTRIKYKIIIIIIIIGTLSAITGSTINYFYELNKTRNQIVTNTLLQASLLSEYCGLPLEFDYPENATEVLEKLYTIPSIHDGVLFTLNDSVFASYHKADSKIYHIPDALRDAEYSIEGNYIHVLHPVIYKGKTYGKLYLRSYTDWKGIASKQFLVTLAVILLMMVLIYILAYFLQGNISNPIAKLTEEMNSVAATKDYTVQFPVKGKDEIAELYSGFNTMLSEILKRDHAFISEKERAETYLNIAEVIILAIDRDSKILLLNRKGYQILGYEKGELLGKEWFKVCIPEEENDAILNVYKDVVDGMNEPSGYYENNIITKNGEKRMVAWHNTYFTDIDGSIAGTLSCGEDITERKKAELLLKEKTNEIESQNEEYLQLNEELLQINRELIKAKEHAIESDRLKTAFLQNMSHEIRTPMNAIMGFSSLLLKSYNDKPKLEKFSTIIGQRCNDLLIIINDILDISKIESGQLPVYMDECNLTELFNELTSFFVEYQERMEKKHINLILNSVSNLPVNVIVTDKGKLKQIFINLLGNAFKFTDSGTIKGGCRLDSSQKLIFFVSDTGIGIPADKQNHIFERFTQLSPGTNRLVTGTGLGLSIVKGLVGLLGGEIFLESTEGEGSTFSFSIPYTLATGVTIVPAEVRKPEKQQVLNKTILIVEDDLFNAEYLKEVLSMSEFTLILSDSGTKAIEIALSQKIDMVLMDIRLPDIDGYSATRLIKLNKPHLKIIAQTAYASDDERQKAMDAGCSDYISKPTKKDLLIAMILKHLNN